MDIIARRTVLKSPGARRVGRYIAAQKTTAFGWIRRIQQSFRFHRPLKITENYTAFRNCVTSAIIVMDNLRDPIQLVRGDDDTAQRNPARDRDGAGARDG